jgi:hypothetical protein
MILKNKDLVAAQVRLKVEEWLATIPNSYLVDRIRESYVVAGGAPVSLLQGETPKDYDIWLMDRALNVDLLNYYFQEPSFSGFNCEYRAEMDRQGTIGITRKYPENLKFNKNNRDWYWVDRSQNSHSPIEILSSRAMTLRNGIQIIYFQQYFDPLQVVNGFDFTHNRCFVTNTTASFPEDALDAIATKTLTFQGSTHPVSALGRVAKYLHRGYTISSKTLLDIARGITELPADDRSKQFEHVVIDSGGDVV